MNYKTTLTGFLLVSRLVFGQQAANHGGEHEENKQLVNDLVQKIGRINDDTICDVLLAESNPRLFFKYASVLARRSNTIDLMRYRDSKHPALSVFAEWQIALRQAEGIWLQQRLQRPSAAPIEVAGEEIDKLLPFKSPIAEQINGIMKHFATEIEKRTDCDVPLRWRMSVELAEFNGYCMCPHVEHLSDIATKRASPKVENGALVLDRTGRVEPRILSVSNDSKVCDYCIDGTECFVALQTKDLGCRELEVRAFTWGQEDVAWKANCVAISCLDAIKGSCDPIVDIAVSRDKRSVTFFVNTGTAFGIDVLDARTGAAEVVFLELSSSRSILVT